VCLVGKSAGQLLTRLKRFSAFLRSNGEMLAQYHSYINIVSFQILCNSSFIIVLYYWTMQRVKEPTEKIKLPVSKAPDMNMFVVTGLITWELFWGWLISGT
jgi:hypothetical protein